MAKKDRKSSKLNKQEIESAAAGEETTGSVPAEVQHESTSSDSSLDEVTVSQASDEQTSANIEDESSSEDLLEGVRRSLIEEETATNKKVSKKWWRRMGRKNKSADPEPPPPMLEIDLPTTSLQTDLVENQTPAAESAKEIDDLIDMLEVEQQESDIETPSVPVGAEISPEPEPEVDIEQLKEQAFRPRTSDGVESDVRSIALEGGEEVFVEVQSQESDPFEERLSAFENALLPYRRYIYMAFAFLGVVMAVIASFLIYSAYIQSRPAPVNEVSNLPYPTSVSLPGGWSFQLGRGTLQNGKWEPRGAEWLEGTEVCRWVSLPWSLQLEAVIRTLEPKDPVELVMSNNDKLVYGVYSVYQMTPEEIHKVDAKTPCLLLILTEVDSEKRWVLTALP